MTITEFREDYKKTIKEYPDITGIIELDDSHKFIIETVTNFERVGSKWVKVQEKESPISFINYCNVVAPETIRFFRRLGGSETVKKNYTKAGFLPVEIISTSPDRQSRTTRKFKFL